MQEVPECNNCDGNVTILFAILSKIRKEAGRTFDGVSRPANDMYREEFNRIFGVNDE